MRQDSATLLGAGALGCQIVRSQEGNVDRLTWKEHQLLLSLLSLCDLKSC